MALDQNPCFRGPPLRAAQACYKANAFDSLPYIYIHMYVDICVYVYICIYAIWFFGPLSMPWPRNHSCMPAANVRLWGRFCKACTPSKPTAPYCTGLCHTHMYASIFLSFYTYIYIHIYIYICISAYTYVCIYLSFCLSIHTYMYVYIYISLCLHTHMYVSVSMSM